MRLKVREERAEVGGGPLDVEWVSQTQKFTEPGSYC